MVIGAVGPGVARSHHRGKDLPGPVARAVIDAGDERGEAIPALVRADTLFLVAMGGDEGGVQVHYERIQGRGLQCRVAVAAASQTRERNSRVNVAKP